jgi:hypothetical protein
MTFNKSQSTSNDGSYNGGGILKKGILLFVVAIFILAVVFLANIFFSLTDADTVFNNLSDDSIVADAWAFRDSSHTGTMTRANLGTGWINIPVGTDAEVNRWGFMGPNNNNNNQATAWIPERVNPENGNKGGSNHGIGLYRETGSTNEWHIMYARFNLNQELTDLRRQGLLNMAAEARFGTRPSRDIGFVGIGAAGLARDHFSHTTTGSNPSGRTGLATLTNQGGTVPTIFRAVTGEITVSNPFPTMGWRQTTDSTSATLTSAWDDTDSYIYIILVCKADGNHAYAFDRINYSLSVRTNVNLNSNVRKALVNIEGQSTGNRIDQVTPALSASMGSTDITSGGVAFSINSGTAQGASAANATVTLSVPATTPNGYVFLGWHFDVTDAGVFRNYNLPTTRLNDRSLTNALEEWGGLVTRHTVTRDNNSTSGVIRREFISQNRQLTLGLFGTGGAEQAGVRAMRVGGVYTAVYIPVVYAVEFDRNTAAPGVGTVDGTTNWLGSPSTNTGVGGRAQFWRAWGVSHQLPAHGLESSNGMRFSGWTDNFNPPSQYSNQATILNPNTTLGTPAANSFAVATTQPMILTARWGGFSASFEGTFLRYVPLTAQDLTHQGVGHLQYFSYYFRVENPNNNQTVTSDWGAMTSAPNGFSALRGLYAVFTGGDREGHRVKLDYTGSGGIWVLALTDGNFRLVEDWETTTRILRFHDARNSRTTDISTAVGQTVSWRTFPQPDDGGASYWFDGWWTATTGGTNISQLDINVTASMGATTTYTARWVGQDRSFAQNTLDTLTLTGTNANGVNTVNLLPSSGVSNSAAGAWAIRERNHDINFSTNHGHGASFFGFNATYRNGTRNSWLSYDIPITGAAARHLDRGGQLEISLDWLVHMHARRTGGSVNVHTHIELSIHNTLTTNNPGLQGNVAGVSVNSGRSTATTATNAHHRISPSAVTRLTITGNPNGTTPKNIRIVFWLQTWCDGVALFGNDGEFSARIARMNIAYRSLAVTEAADWWVGAGTQKFMATFNGGGFNNWQHTVANNIDFTLPQPIAYTDSTMMFAGWLQGTSQTPQRAGTTVRINGNTTFTASFVRRRYTVGARDLYNGLIDTVEGGANNSVEVWRPPTTRDHGIAMPAVQAGAQTGYTLRGTTVGTHNSHPPPQTTPATSATVGINVATQTLNNVITVSWRINLPTVTTQNVTLEYGQDCPTFGTRGIMLDNYLTVEHLLLQPQHASVEGRTVTTLEVEWYFSGGGLVSPERDYMFRSVAESSRGNSNRFFVARVIITRMVNGQPIRYIVSQSTVPINATITPIEIKFVEGNNTKPYDGIALDRLPGGLELVNNTNQRRVDTFNFEHGGTESFYGAVGRGLDFDISGITRALRETDFNPAELFLHVGTYYIAFIRAVFGDNADNTNYTFAFTGTDFTQQCNNNGTPRTYTITPANLMVTLGFAEKTYGENDPARVPLASELLYSSARWEMSIEGFLISTDRNLIFTETDEDGEIFTEVVRNILRRVDENGNPTEMAGTHNVMFHHASVPALLRNNYDFDFRAWDRRISTNTARTLNQYDINANPSGNARGATVEGFFEIYRRQVTIVNWTRYFGIGDRGFLTGYMFVYCGQEIGWQARLNNVVENDRNNGDFLYFVNVAYRTCAVCTDPDTVCEHCVGVTPLARVNRTGADAFFGFQFFRTDQNQHDLNGYRVVVALAGAHAQNYRFNLGETPDIPCDGLCKEDDCTYTQCDGTCHAPCQCMLTREFRIYRRTISINPAEDQDLQPVYTGGPAGIDVTLGNIVAKDTLLFEIGVNRQSITLGAPGDPPQINPTPSIPQTTPATFMFEFTHTGASGNAITLDSIIMQFRAQAVLPNNGLYTITSIRLVRAGANAGDNYTFAQSGEFAWLSPEGNRSWEIVMRELVLTWQRVIHDGTANHNPSNYSVITEGDHQFIYNTRAQGWRLSIAGVASNDVGFTVGLNGDLAPFESASNVATVASGDSVYYYFTSVNAGDFGLRLTLTGAGSGNYNILSGLTRQFEIERKVLDITRLYEVNINGNRPYAGDNFIFNGQDHRIMAGFAVDPSELETVFTSDLWRLMSNSWQLLTFENDTRVNASTNHIVIVRIAQNAVGRNYQLNADVSGLNQRLPSGSVASYSNTFGAGQETISITWIINQRELEFDWEGIDEGIEEKFSWINDRLSVEYNGNERQIRPVATNLVDADAANATTILLYRILGIIPPTHFRANVGIYTTEITSIAPGFDNYKLPSDTSLLQELWEIRLRTINATWTAPLSAIYTGDLQNTTVSFDNLRQVEPTVEPTMVKLTIEWANTTSAVAAMHFGSLDAVAHVSSHMVGSVEWFRATVSKPLTTSSLTATLSAINTGLYRLVSIEIICINHAIGSVAAIANGLNTWEITPRPISLNFEFASLPHPFIYNATDQGITLTIGNLVRNATSLYYDRIELAITANRALTINTFNGVATAQSNEFDFKAINAGGYEIAIANALAGGQIWLGGHDGGNYRLPTTVPLGQFTISPKEIDIVWFGNHAGFNWDGDVLSTEYNGLNQYISARVVDGSLYGDDTVTFIYSGTRQAVNASVTDYIAIATLAEGNYVIANGATQNWRINHATITLSFEFASSPHPFTFNGEQQGVVLTVSGIMQNAGGILDQITLSYTLSHPSMMAGFSSGAAVVNGVHEFTARDVGTFVVTITAKSGLQSANYVLNVTVPLVQEFTINPKPIEIEWFGNHDGFNWNGDVLSTQYNGLNQYISARVVGSLYGSDTVTFIYSDTSTRQARNVGANDFTVEATLAAGANYVISGNAEQAWRITPREINLSFSNNNSQFTYNGESQGIALNVSNIVSGDEIALILQFVNESGMVNNLTDPRLQSGSIITNRSYLFEAINANAGVYGVSVLGLEGADKDNYIITIALELLVGQFEILRKTLDASLNLNALRAVAADALEYNALARTIGVGNDVDIQISYASNHAPVASQMGVGLATNWPQQIPLTVVTFDIEWVVIGATSVADATKVGQYRVSINLSTTDPLNPVNANYIMAQASLEFSIVPRRIEIGNLLFDVFRNDGNTSQLYAQNITWSQVDLEFSDGITWSFAVSGVNDNVFNASGVNARIDVEWYFGLCKCGELASSDLDYHHDHQLGLSKQGPENAGTYWAVLVFEGADAHNFTFEFDVNEGYNPSHFFAEENGETFLISPASSPAGARITTALPNRFDVDGARQLRAVLRFTVEQTDGGFNPDSNTHFETVFDGWYHAPVPKLEDGQPTSQVYAYIGSTPIPWATWVTTGGIRDVRLVWNEVAERFEEAAHVINFVIKRGDEIITGGTCNFAAGAMSSMEVTLLITRAEIVITDTSATGQTGQRQYDGTYAYTQFNHAINVPTVCAIGATHTVFRLPDITNVTAAYSNRNASDNFDNLITFTMIGSAAERNNFKFVSANTDWHGNNIAETFYGRINRRQLTVNWANVPIPTYNGLMQIGAIANAGNLVSGEGIDFVLSDGAAINQGTYTAVITGLAVREGYELTTSINNYSFSDIENDGFHERAWFMRARVVEIVWVTNQNANEDNYLDYLYTAPFIYSGATQGVFPFIVNRVGTDAVAFNTVQGNTATNANDSYLAQILQSDGLNNPNYTLTGTLSSLTRPWAIDRADMVLDIDKITVPQFDALEFTQIYDAQTWFVLLNGALSTTAQNQVVVVPVTDLVSKQVTSAVGFSDTLNITFEFSVDASPFGAFNGARNVGEYLIRFSIISDNYNPVNGSTLLKITPATAVVVWSGDQASYVYNAFDQRGSVAATVNLLATDIGTVTVTLEKGAPPVAVAEFKNAGTYMFTASLDNTNYVICATSVERIIVMQQAVVGTHVFAFLLNHQTEYSAETVFLGLGTSSSIANNAPFNNDPRVALLGSDNIQVEYRYSLTGLGDFETWDIFNGKVDAGVYHIRARISGELNYADWTSATATLTITRVTLNANWIGSGDAWTKVFDGTTSLSNTLFSVGVFRGADANNILVTATFDDRNVAPTGTFINITFTLTNLNGADVAKNYIINNMPNGVITPLGLTRNIASTTRVYNGTDAFALANDAISGVIEPDVVAVLAFFYNSETNQRTRHVRAPEATWTHEIRFTLTGANANNYFVESITQNVDITPLAREIIWTWTGTTLTFNGLNRSADVRARFALVGEDTNLRSDSADGTYYTFNIVFTAANHAVFANPAITGHTEVDFRNAGSYGGHALWTDRHAEIQHNYSFNNQQLSQNPVNGIGRVLTIEKAQLDIDWNILAYYIYNGSNHQTQISVTLFLFGISGVREPVVLTHYDLVLTYRFTTTVPPLGMRNAGWYNLKIDIAQSVLDNYLYDDNLIARDIEVRRANITNIEFSGTFDCEIEGVYNGRSFNFFAVPFGGGGFEMLRGATSAPITAATTALFYYHDPTLPINISYVGGAGAAPNGNWIVNSRFEMEFTIAAEVLQTPNYNGWEGSITVRIYMGRLHNMQFNGVPARDYDGHYHSAVAFNEGTGDNRIARYTDNTNALVRYSFRTQICPVENTWTSWSPFASTASFKNAGVYEVRAFVAETQNYHSWYYGHPAEEQFVRVTILQITRAVIWEFDGEYPLDITYNSDNQKELLTARINAVGLDGIAGRISLVITLTPLNPDYDINGGNPNELRLAGRYVAVAVFNAENPELYAEYNRNYNLSLNTREGLNAVEVKRFIVELNWFYRDGSGNVVPFDGNQITYDGQQHSVYAVATGANGVVVPLLFNPNPYPVRVDAGRFNVNIQSIMPRSMPEGLNTTLGYFYDFNYMLPATSLSQAWEIQKRQVNITIVSDMISKMYDGSPIFTIGSTISLGRVDQGDGTWTINRKTAISVSACLTPMLDDCDCCIRWSIGNLIQKDLDLLAVMFSINSVTANRANVSATTATVSFGGFSSVNYFFEREDVDTETVIKPVDCTIVPRPINVYVDQGEAEFNGRAWNITYGNGAGERLISQTQNSVFIRSITSLIDGTARETVLVDGNFFVGQIWLVGYDYQRDVNDNPFNRITNGTLSDAGIHQIFVNPNIRFATLDADGHENYIVTIVGNDSDFEVTQREIRVNYTNTLQSIWDNYQRVAIASVEYLPSTTLTYEEFLWLMEISGMFQGGSVYTNNFSVVNDWIRDWEQLGVRFTEYRRFGDLGDDEGLSVNLSGRNQNNFKFLQPVVQLTYLRIRCAENYEFLVSSREDVMRLGVDIAGLNFTRDVYLQGVIPSYFQTQNIDMVYRGRLETFTTIPLFEGLYDGGGHFIRNLYITPATGVNNTAAGMFGTLEGGTVRNLTLLDFTVLGNDIANTFHMGAIAGRVRNGTIENVTVQGTIITSNRDVLVGGIAGYAYGSQITGCVALVTILVTGSRYATVGGIVGLFEVSFVEEIEMRDEYSGETYMVRVYNGKIDEIESFAQINANSVMNLNASPLVGGIRMLGETSFLSGIEGSLNDTTYLNNSIFVNGVQAAGFDSGKTFAEIINENPNLKRVIVDHYVRWHLLPISNADPAATIFYTSFLQKPLQDVYWYMDIRQGSSFIARGGS